MAAANAALREKFEQDCLADLAAVMQHDGCFFYLVNRLVSVPLNNPARSVVAKLVEAEVLLFAAEKCIPAAVQLHKETHHGGELSDIVPEDVDPEDFKQVKPLIKNWSRSVKFYQSWHRFWAAISDVRREKHGTKRKLVEAAAAHAQYVEASTPVLNDAFVALQCGAGQEDIGELADRIMECKDELLGDHRDAADVVKGKFEDSPLGQALGRVQFYAMVADYYSGLLSGVARKSFGPFAERFLGALRNHVKAASLGEDDKGNFFPVELSKAFLERAEADLAKTCLGACCDDCKDGALPLCKWNLSLHHSLDEECKCQARCNEPSCSVKDCCQDHLEDDRLEEVPQDKNVPEEEAAKTIDQVEPVPMAVLAAEAKAEAVEAEVAEPVEDDDPEATESETEERAPKRQKLRSPSPILC